MLKLRAMKYESPYQPWRADESWSFTLVGVFASHRFGSLQKPEKRHTTSRIFGRILDISQFSRNPVVHISQCSWVPGKTGRILPLEKSGKTQPDAAEMSPNVEMYYFWPWFRGQGVFNIRGNRVYMAIWLYYIYIGYIWWNFTFIWIPRIRSFHQIFLVIVASHFLSSHVRWSKSYHLTNSNAQPLEMVI